MEKSMARSDEENTENRKTVNPWNDEKGAPASDPATRNDRRDDPQGDLGEKFGTDYGFGQEGERVEPQGGPVDEGSEFLDYYEEPSYTELMETESPFGDEPPPDLVPQDDEIYREIYDRLSTSRRVDVSAIEIGVTEGVVTLSGKVGSGEELEHAEDVAATVLGVRQVLNTLRVR